MRPVDADELHMYYEKRMYFERHRNHAYLKGVRDCIKDLESQPTIESEQKKGQWINDNGLYKCTSCGELWTQCWASCVPIAQMYKELKYCPKCGAPMEEEENDK